MENVRTIKTAQTTPHETSRYMFSNLVDEYSDAVYRFCLKLAYSKEDAEDLYQEAFLHAFEQHNELKTSDNPKSFLFRAMVNIWKGWKRKYARRNRLVPVQPLDNEAIAGEASLEDGFIAREESRIVGKLVDALPDKYKIPIILYYTVEMGLADIAATLKLPEGTVKSRLYKARKTLKKGLDLL